MPDYAMIQGTLPLLALRSVLLLPGATAPLELGRTTASSTAVKRASEHPQGDPCANLLIVAVQRESSPHEATAESLYGIGVLTEIVQVRHGVPGRFTGILRGIARVNILDLSSAPDHQTCRFERSIETSAEPTLSYALGGALQDLLKQHDELLPSSAKTKVRSHELAKIAALRSPGEIADRSASHIQLDDEERLEVLQEPALNERLRKVIELVSRAANTLQVKRDLDRAVREHLSKHEHNALLRHKLRAIQSELGETQSELEERWFAEIESRIADAGLPPEVRAIADRELGRLRRMNRQSSESMTTRTYLDWLASLPWSTTSESPAGLELGAARELLDEQHYGLKRVKKRVLEYLSVRKLAPQKRGPILCLSGPPGVGKTSLGRSIAEALGRPLVRISLGGVRDDAEIRGHRRTYVGALPGRLIQAMKRAGTRDPVIMLDEIDKLGDPNMRGDPASALLEALDPEQNDAFSDHYISVDYDLSQVIFIATANNLGGIPGVLRDRLEIIELPGYTIDEKVAIAQQHLLPKQRHEHGIANLGIEISDELLEVLASSYTRESGVRNLEREIASLLRDVAMHTAEGKPSPGALSQADIVKILGPPRFHNELAAKQPAPGVVTGLGWTSVGGTLLFVEVTVTAGKGRLRRTGRLGSVMKESAQAALSYVRSRAPALGIDNNFMSSHDIHVHFPAGGVAKDGPSAGIAIATALVSALLDRPVRVDVAMTGEITLRGHVLPIGGVREKVLAAHRAGIREVILPERNRKDEPELPEQVRDEMTLHFVRSVSEVLELMLLPADTEAAAE